MSDYGSRVRWEEADRWGYEEALRHPRPEPLPYAAGIQREADAILADYNQHIYVRGWIGTWMFNLTHWIVTEKELADEALQEVARLREEVA